MFKFRNHVYNLETLGDDIFTEDEFIEFMEELEKSGWNKKKEEDKEEEKNMMKMTKEVFKKIDQDDSGFISKKVCKSNYIFFKSFQSFQEIKMASKLIQKKFGIKDVRKI